MSSEPTSSDTCQVDFYLMGESSSTAAHLACRLALMAWERQQKIFIITASESSSEQLDELMWRQPEGRFLPHARAGSAGYGKAPVVVGTLSGLNPTDVVINLCPEAVPQPERFNRVLEIVPYAKDERKASRVKYKTYRSLGLEPRTHEMGTPPR